MGCHWNNYTYSLKRHIGHCDHAVVKDGAENNSVGLRMGTETFWPKDSRSGNQIGAAACVP